MTGNRLTMSRIGRWSKISRHNWKWIAVSAALGGATAASPAFAADNVCYPGQFDCWQARGDFQILLRTAHWDAPVYGADLIFAHSRYDEPYQVKIGEQGGRTFGSVGSETYPEGKLPSEVRSIAVSVDGPMNDRVVRILSADGVVRVAKNQDDGTHEAGTYFPIVEDVLQPVLDDGSAIDLCEITAAKINVNVPQSAYLLGRGCNGVLYHNAGFPYWTRAADHPAFQDGPTSNIKGISSVASFNPVLWTNAGEVWLVGRGTMQMVAGRSDYVRLPALKAPAVVSESTGEVLGITSSGGLYVLTDAGDGTCRPNVDPAIPEYTCDGDEDRLYKFNVAANKWEPFAQGNLPWHPSAPADATHCPGTPTQPKGCNAGFPCSEGGVEAICDYYSEARYSRLEQSSSYGVSLGHESWTYLWNGTPPPVDEVTVPDMSPFVVTPYGGTNPNVLVNDTTSYTQGTSSLLFNAPGFSEVTTDVFEVPRVSSHEILIDAYVPKPSSSGWAGMVQYYLYLPNRGFHHDWIGQVNLPNGTNGAWVTLSVSIPNAMFDAMKNAEGEPMQLGIAVNSPFGANGTGVRLDNLRVGGAGGG